MPSSSRRARAQHGPQPGGRGLGYRRGRPPSATTGSGMPRIVVWLTTIDRPCPRQMLSVARVMMKGWGNRPKTKANPFTKPEPPQAHRRRRDNDDRNEACDFEQRLAQSPVAGPGSQQREGSMPRVEDHGVLRPSATISPDDEVCAGICATFAASEDRRRRGVTSASGVARSGSGPRSTSGRAGSWRLGPFLAFGPSGRATPVSFVPPAFLPSCFLFDKNTG